MKVIVINAKERKVETTNIKGDLASLRNITEGPICFAKEHPNGDVLFVNDTGLLDPNINYFFSIKDGHQPFAGNGVLVGMEEENFEDGTYKTHDVTSTEKDLDIKFFTREEVWAGLY
jgi:hypothetical protein